MAGFGVRSNRIRRWAWYVVLLGVLVVPALVTTAGASATSPSPSPSPSPTGVVQESTRQAKVGLINQLAEPPHTVFFGSSRAMRVNPADYLAITGRTAFNAAVSSGSIADVYCFSQLIRERFPGTTQRYVWFLDVEQFRQKNVNRAIFAQPELAKFIPAGFPSPYAGQELPPAPPPPQPPEPWGKIDVFHPDGYLRWNRYDYQAPRGRTLKKGIAYHRWMFASVYPKGYPRLYGTPKWFMEQTLRMMDRWGSYPVVVLTPYHPSIHKFISERGYLQRYRQVWNYLKRLQRSGLRFAVLNMTRIERFGGWPNGFYDGTHMRTTMCRILLEKVIALTGDLLR